MRIKKAMTAARSGVSQSPSMKASAKPMSIPLNARPLRYIAGRISLYSYSIYLVHFPALFVMCRLFGVDSSIGTAKLIAAVMVWLATTIAVSALVFHSFEGPVSDIRERFTRRVNANPF